VVVVAYGAPELVRGAIEPLVRDFPVTVVDNSSLPEIRAVAEELGAVYLDPSRNGGFAAGVNHALANRRAEGADVLLVNPDAVVSPTDVRELHRALLAAPDLASVGPLQIDGAGIPARVAWPFPSPTRAWMEALGLGFLRRREDFVIGSVLLLRAEALDDVGGLDERFFLYAEETDWAYRAHRRGWRHAVVSGARAMHLGGATSSDPGRRETHFHASQERYQRKHFGAGGWRAVRAAAVLGSVVRAVLLGGERGHEARRRLRLYVEGPVRAEQRLLDTKPPESAHGGPPCE
jgi:GT2 family glycosyltransferase